MMARTKKERHIKCKPICYLFGPLPNNKKNDVIDLWIDEYEAIRLSNIENLAMIEAAKKMKISAPTFCRILKSGNKKVADALINNKKLKVCIEKCE